MSPPSRLRRAAAPCLLIGGTADKVRDGRLARSLTPHVLKIDRADHGMLVPGHLAGVRHGSGPGDNDCGELPRPPAMAAGALGKATAEPAGRVTASHRR